MSRPQPPSRTTPEPPPFPEDRARGTRSAGADDIDLSDRRPLPRITIQAFLESASTVAAMRRAGQDRRLARVNLSVAKGGILAAASQFARHPSGDVVVVESQADEELLLAQIDALAEVCEMGTRVVVIGAINDAALFRALRRRGVEDYLLSAPTPNGLLDALTGLYARRTDDGDGKITAFIGARGGAGSSTLAHNTAWSLAHHHTEETLLADFDLAFGTAALNFNCDAAQTIAEALTAADHLDVQLMDRIKTQIGDRLYLLAAPETLDLPAVSETSWDNLLHCARLEASQTVLDLPSQWSDWVGALVTHADQVVLTVTPDLAALRNGRMILTAIKRARPHDKPPVIVLNQVGMPGRQDIPDKAIVESLGAKPVYRIPFDAALFTQAANSGQTVFEDRQDTPAARAISALARHLCGAEDEPYGARKGGVLTGLLSRLKAPRKQEVS